MPTRVQLPDGSVGEFPDGMSDSQIESVLQKQYGAPPPPPSVPPQEGFGASLLSGLGGMPQAPTTLRDGLKQAATAAFGGPIVPLAQGLYEGGKRSFGELKQSLQGAMSGNPAAAAQHAITALPIVGPALDKGADQFADKNYTGEGGTLTAAALNLAPLALGAVDAAMPGRTPFGALPSKAHAGQLFESVMKDASTQPVQMTRTTPLVERAMQLSERGHGTVTPLERLYSRINQTQPLEYAEARDRASALSSLTAEDRIKATKTLLGATKQVVPAFNADIGDAAAAVGRGEDYARAMKEYRRAAQLNEGLRTTAKYGAGVAGGAIVGPKLYGYLKSMM